MIKACIAVAALLVTLGACASTGAGASPQALQQKVDVLDLLQQQDKRVATVAFRLQTAAVGLCRVTVPLSGLVLHDALEYDRGSRPTVISHFQLGDGTGILAVVDDSPASRAGLMADDTLLAINGRSLTTSPTNDADLTRRAPTLDPISQARSLVDGELAKGPAQVTVRRAVGQLTVTLTPVPGCEAHVELNPSNKMQAEQSGTQIVISTAMTHYAATDDQLADILGHEIAHILLGDPALMASLRPPGGPADARGVAWAGDTLVERDADYLGLYLAARAGFDIGVAEGFWRQMSKDFPMTRLQLDSHPGSAARIVAMQSTIAEINTKRQRGQPLAPETARTQTPP